MTPTLHIAFRKRLMVLVAALLAGFALSSMATAGAEPREWDVGAYDQCWNSGLGIGLHDAEWDEHVQYCCIKSGGDWVAAPGAGKHCVAPQAQEAERAPAQTPIFLPETVATLWLPPPPNPNSPNLPGEPPLSTE